MVSMRSDSNNNNNNNRELIERFWKLKALYNLKKNIQCADTHNYTNQWYTSVQNWRLCFHSPIAYSTAVKGVEFGLSVDWQCHAISTDRLSVCESVEPSARSSLLGQYERESVV